MEKVHWAGIRPDLSAMDQTERFYRIEQMLRDRGVAPIAAFLDTLEVSRATFKRDIEYMRDRLHAPIEWDRERGATGFSPRRAPRASSNCRGFGSTPPKRTRCSPWNSFSRDWSRDFSRGT